MGKNTKPILSVLVDDDKKKRFAALARRYKRSMGWIVNDCIDRILAADSIDIYGGNALNIPIEDVNRLPASNSTSIGLSVESIDEMVRTAVEQHLSDSSGLTANEIERVAIETIEQQLAVLQSGQDASRQIEAAIAPVTRSLEELRTSTKKELEEMRKLIVSM